MSTEVLFQIANMTALLAWAFLILGNSWARRWPTLQPAKISFALALALSVFYGVGVLMNFSFSELAQMNRLEGLQNFFARQQGALWGSVHFLALDLIMGCWISMDAKKWAPAAWWTSIVLALTFLFGPLGLVIYFGIRAMPRRKAKAV